MNLVDQLWNQLTSVRRDRALNMAFRRLLLGDNGRPTMNAAMVLAHLRMFCGADTPTRSLLRYDRNGAVDTMATGAAIGRQEVWRQIEHYLGVDDDELLEMDRVLQRDIRSRMQQPLDA